MENTSEAMVSVVELKREVVLAKNGQNISYFEEVERQFLLYPYKSCKIYPLKGTLQDPVF